MLELLKTPNGANFILADLHVHTPFDSRFRQAIREKYPLRNDEEKKQFIRDFFTFAINERGLGILGITEHNDISYLTLYQTVKKEPAFQSLILFPGVEVSSREGIHLLVLFNPGENAAVIDAFLSEIGLTPGHRFQGKRVLPSRLGFIEILNLVAEKYSGREKQSSAALVIAAHFDQDNGLGKQENAKTFYGHSHLCAVQISKPYSMLRAGHKDILDGKHADYHYKQVAVIEASDCRAIEEVGKCASYIKIGSPTIEGLKQAFLDAKSRIRHIRLKQSNHFSTIQAAGWEGGFLDGLKIHFNSNMNCLIGGKGTGKSTVIETLRYGLGGEPRSPAGKQNAVELLKTVFGKGSKISLLVYSSDLRQQFIIERTYGADPRILDLDGIPLNLVPQDILPQLEIFGQKEIYEISNNHEFQYELIRKFFRNELDQLEQRQGDILNELRQNKTAILQLKQKIENKENQVADLCRLQEQRKIYQTSQFAEHFNDKRKYESEQVLLKRLEQKLTAFTEQLAQFQNAIDLDFSFLSPEETSELINTDILNRMFGLIQDFQKQMLHSLDESGRQLIELKNQIETEQNNWYKNYQSQEEIYQERIRKIRQETQLNPDELIQIERRIEQLLVIQRELVRDQQQLATLQQVRWRHKTELNQVRNAIYEKSTALCEQRINQQLTGILNVKLEFEGNKNAFVSHLLDLKSGVQRRQLETIVNQDDFSLHAFIDTLRRGGADFAEKYQISPATAERLYRAMDDEFLMDLESFEIPTKITISLNTGAPLQPNFKDTNHLSVGQKCTAILTLILMESPYPLIVDQPEDDLDNSYIFDDIVQKLRAEKERRQFIIATHNANIPILGDAEQIIVLAASDERIDQNQIKKGSIDDVSLKEPVEKILEGGRQAFELRKMKYGF